MKYIKEELAEAVLNSSSWRLVCEKLNRKPSCRNQGYIKSLSLKWELDFSHFLGLGWNRGLQFTKQDINKYLNNEIRISSHKLKLRMLKDGIKKHICEICENTNWLGGKIPLELHHIDSNHCNNNLSNIQLLCPNCHSLETAKMFIKEPKIDKRKDRPTRIHLRKVKNRPSVNILIDEVDDIGYSAVGRKYGVSDNCIRKWIKAG